MPDDAWDSCAFPGTFRASQTRALEAVDAVRFRGGTRAWVALPGGAGKTVVGLEVARRLRRRTLVLVPSTVVQQQWLTAWRKFAPGAGTRGSGPHPVPGGDSGSLGTGVTVLTYAALSAWDRAADDEDVEDLDTAAVAARRRAAVRGDRDADLLELLHPRGREVVDRASRLGPWTLVLDESAHLLETWGPLVGALAAALGGDTFVLGLTATPPEALSARARTLCEQVFGTAGLMLPVPELVARGEIAPYQELVHFTGPTPAEQEQVSAEATRFAALQNDLATRRTGPLSFAGWLRRRVEERRTPDGGPGRPWREFAAAEPDLARAALRLVGIDDGPGLLALPDGARLREEHQVPPDARDWAVLLDAYAHEHLMASPDLDDQRLLARIRQVLPSLGFSLTARGLRATTSPVDRICALSAAKADAAVEVLATEIDVRGDTMRALVACDAEQRRDGGGPLPGSARSTWRALATSRLGDVLRPVLVTGRTVAVRRADLADFRASEAVRRAGFSDRLVTEPVDGDRSLVRVSAGQGWTARVWTRLVTAWLEEGGTRAVVSTRGFLGEGWDCPAVDVVVDLSTSGDVTALRGRALRRDPARPEQVADIWTVVCVTDSHPRGDADYLRAVAKHDRHVAPGASGGLEFGIGHGDDALGPYAAPAAAEREAVTARCHARARDAVTAVAEWRAIDPGSGGPVHTLRVRAERSLGLPGRLVPAALLAPSTTLGTDAPAPTPYGGRPARLWPLPGLAGLTAGAGALAAATPVTGLAAAAGTALAAGAVLAAGRSARQRQALEAAPTDASATVLGQLAAAVADALHAGGGTSAGAAAVEVRGGPDGWLGVELDADGSELFAACLDELLAPLADPRWLVSRLVLPEPADLAARQRLARARALGRPVPAAVAWHAVPTWLGRSRERVAAFDEAWHRHVGPGRFVLARDEEGELLLDLLRGADPFGITSRLRVLWR